MCINMYSTYLYILIHTHTPCTYYLMHTNLPNLPTTVVYLVTVLKQLCQLKLYNKMYVANGKLCTTSTYATIYCITHVHITT